MWKGNISRASNYIYKIVYALQKLIIFCAVMEKILGLNGFAVIAG